MGILEAHEMLTMIGALGGVGLAIALVEMYFHVGG